MTTINSVDEWKKDMKIFKNISDLDLIKVFILRKRKNSVYEHYIKGVKQN
jgi:hypothetical protein